MQGSDYAEVQYEDVRLYELYGCYNPNQYLYKEQDKGKYVKISCYLMTLVFHLILLI